MAETKKKTRGPMSPDTRFARCRARLRDMSPEVRAEFFRRMKEAPPDAEVERAIASAKIEWDGCDTDGKSELNLLYGPDRSPKPYEAEPEI